MRFHPSGALVLVGEGNASRRNPFALSFDNLLKGVATKGNVGAYSLAELLSDIFYKRRESDFIFRVVGNDKNLTPVKAWFRLFRESNECKQGNGVPSFGVAEINLFSGFFVDGAHALAEGIHDPCRALAINVFLLDRECVANYVVCAKKCCSIFFTFGFKTGVHGKIANI